MLSDNAFLEKLCKKYDVDYKLAKKLKEKIFPLLEKAHKTLGYRFDKAITEQRRGTDIRLANSAVIQLILRKINPQFFSIRERAIVSLHLEYLSLVEAYFATQINFLVFTLIANGYDMSSTLKGEKVERLDDIEKVNLASKLKFLRRHGFGFVTRKLNIKLRNSVAHLFYYIDKNGVIRFGKQKVTQTDYKNLYSDLRNVSFGLQLVNLTYYRRFA